MKMNLTSMMMITIIMITTITVISSNNFLTSWLMMEINMIAFLPIMSKSNKMKDQLMKYFIVQSTASSIMLMSMLMNSNSETPTSTSIMLMMSLLMKMGLMPMHIWMPVVMNSLSWKNCMIMSTIQKIIPITISSQLSSINTMMLPMVTSMIAAPISALSQLSMKKILSFSSIANTPWMMISMNNSKSQFMLFMTVYSTITMMAMNKLNKMNILFINQMKMLTTTQKLSFVIMSMSMSGMPPTTGFLPKWIIIQSTIQFSTALTMSMISSSIISTFIYLKMMNSNLLSHTSMKKTKKKKNMWNNDLTINLLGLPSMMVLKSI
uniref:NADH-ubiquinone oxidoreductase chain 2 n=1 Tax=Cromna sinensis TaxID=2844952 RepID=A0A8H2SMZ1_9HEMI|nr:NADH dehydrogenase subunit 2 [Cromna sinensis]